MNKPSRLCSCVAMGNAQCSAEHPPSMPTDTHVIKCDLFFESVERDHLRGRECVWGASVLEQFGLFQSSFKDSEAQKKKTLNKLKIDSILIAAPQPRNQHPTPVGAKQSASSLPDSQYIVIHCTPAAGPHTASPSALQPLMAQ